MTQEKMAMIIAKQIYELSESHVSLGKEIDLYVSNPLIAVMPELLEVTESCLNGMTMEKGEDVFFRLSREGDEIKAEVRRGENIDPRLRRMLKAKAITERK